MSTGGADHTELDHQGDTPSSPSEKEGRPRNLPRGRNKTYIRRGGRPILPQAEPKDLTTAAVYLNSMWMGCTIQRLRPEANVEKMQHPKSRVYIHEARFRAKAPKKVPDAESSQDNVVGQYGGVLWRARLGYQKIWTYADSLEHVLLGLCDMHQACYVVNDEDNERRWEEYRDCLEVKAHLPIPDTTTEYRVCSRCGTSYFERKLDEHFCEEIDPPYDPVGDRQCVPNTAFYIFQDGKVFPEGHIVRWATWMSGADRKLLCTRIGTVTVTTEFLGYCELPRPLLFETHVTIGKDIFPIARHGTMLEASLVHDKTVAELKKAKHGPTQ